MFVCFSVSHSFVGLQQEGGLKLTFQKQGPPQKRPLESEEGPQAQQQYLARLHELQSASDTGLADITKPQCSFPTGVFDLECCSFYSLGGAVSCTTTRWHKGAGLGTS